MATKVHYISVYKLQAVNSLPGQGSGIELATFAKPSFKALPDRRSGTSLLSISTARTPS
jgi:hypothetical protein